MSDEGINRGRERTNVIHKNMRALRNYLQDSQYPLCESY